MLQPHPDRRFVKFILQGIAEGFRIGFNFTKELKSSGGNMDSAYQNSEVVARYIQEEVSLGRMIGPLPAVVARRVHCSPFGVIPKGHTPGKWRLIVDLSSPKKFSVNDGIDPSWCSLSYVTVDRVASQAGRLGLGTLMAKVDVRSAYRIIPVKPEDRLLLGMRWGGHIYVDACLPFGLRSAPLIFTAVADGLEWIVKRQGVQFIYHYLDDYIMLGAPGTSECLSNVRKLVEYCKLLGVPLAQEKSEGPTTCLTFLGIEVDTEQMQLRLPREKLDRVRHLIKGFLGAPSALKSDLESLLGLLQHASRVVKPGRSFVRRLIEAIAPIKKKSHYVRMNVDVRSDLFWWDKFLVEWNGVGVIPSDDIPIAKLHSDASGAWGCAAVAGKSWFQLEWKERAREWHIAAKELLPIVLACLIWGKPWSGMRVQCYCDNMAAVEVVNGGYSKDEVMMHLVRCLFFTSEHFKFSVEAVHLPGSLNTVADALSRNYMSQFLQVMPEADPQPVPIPGQALWLLIEERPNWTSVNWTELFVACTKQG